MKKCDWDIYQKKYPINIKKKSFPIPKLLSKAVEKQKNISRGTPEH